ncbi:MAG: phosphate ABC transporter substrate-binding protein PstS [Thermaceae bacterium]|nr:phosphate ABC transporter substrate-binding protein PstS [Thermaceae bacterium]
MKGILAVATATLALGLATAQTLTGAGSTFALPLQTETYIPNFTKATGIRVNYQGVGSGAGIRQLTDKVVNFAGSDAPLTDAQLKDIEAKTGSKVLHIPIALGPVAITYNLPGITDLRLDAEVLAQIMLGKIVRWSDPKIAALNPNLKLPNLMISAAHRSDGSGTTFIFTSYLAAISPEWKSKVGAGQAVNWPAFSALGGKGNPGVAAIVAQTQGAIGYVEIKFALENKLPMAELKNASGNYIKPSLESSKEAVAGVEIPEDLRLPNQIVNTKAPQGYPIVGATWMLVYQKQEVSAKSEADAKAMVKYLEWILTDGQKLNEGAIFVKLAPDVVQRALALVATMTYNGKPLK